MSVVACAACGAEVPPEQRFCGECGTAMSRACAACGAALAPGQRFCGECGTAAGAHAAPASIPPAVGRPERRLVTVLFADLVAFTTLSEARDPEAVRDMLERYFERCRTIIARYGGTVEKFIGDAVMAVWGVPVAREDDAERAVRAALELVGAVTALGEELGMPGLRVRAGLLMGETAVNVGAEHEGMVVGDAVNTASRIQSLAEPGVVLVEDATRRATEAAIAFEDAGTHTVKGRAQPVRLWRALRVTAGVGGQRRGSGLEAPFVGRDAELRAITLAGERVLTGGRAELVTVLGEAGMGKSRLAWELEKRVDGIADHVFWHRGRCLSYGEGVSFWALAEIVRMRAAISEDDPAVVARDKLRETVDTFLVDERDRRLVLPRLEQLLGLGEGGGDAGDLFSGWRLFFERLAEVHPVVMVFEDLQWADTGLLEFIDHLIEWAADSPILVLALARPDVLERRPGWRAAAHVLAPLGPAAMHDLLSGLIPGLPEVTVARLAERAEGIPLYAVETVRMMLDRGVIAPQGDVYVVTADVEDVQVPETLHALVASRLDSLSEPERRLLQDASVLGQTFTPEGVAALTGLSADEVKALLDRLVVKQIVEVEYDPRSPERGQYGFAQALLRAVAYGTLGRRERKARHLAAARHLERAWREGADDIAEVLATHYSEAVRAEPDAPDAEALRTRASDTLGEAGRRAMSFGLGAEAYKWYLRAAEMTNAPLRQAELLDLAAQGAYLAQLDDAQSTWDRARSLYEAAGETRHAAVVRARQASRFVDEGRSEDGIEALTPILEELGTTDVDADVAFVAHQLARMYMNSSRRVEGLRPVDVALEYAERAGDAELLADALVTRGTLLTFTMRVQESVGIMRHALQLALDADRSTPALRAYNNLLLPLYGAGRYEECVQMAQEAIVLAERTGHRLQAQWLAINRALALVELGRWDEVVDVPETLTGFDRRSALLAFAPVYAERRDPRLAEALEVARAWQDAQDAEERFLLADARATAAMVAGDPVEALDTRLAAHDHAQMYFSLRLAPATLEAAAAAQRPEAVEDLIDRWLAAGAWFMSPKLQGAIAAFRGRVAGDAGDAATAAAELQRAVDHFRGGSVVFELGKALRDLGVLRGDAACEAEARALFTRLGAVARLDGPARPADEALIA